MHIYLPRVRCINSSRSFSHERQPHKTSSDIRHILTALFETNIKWLVFNYFSINGDWSAKFGTCAVWKADNVFSIPRLYEQRHTVLFKHSNESIYLWSISVTHHVMAFEWLQGKAFKNEVPMFKISWPLVDGTRLHCFATSLKAHTHSLRGKAQTSKAFMSSPGLMRFSAEPQKVIILKTYTTAAHVE